MFSKLVALSFSIYMIYTFYSIWLLVQPPVCSNDHLCLYSVLQKYPNLKLRMFVSVKWSPSSLDVFPVQIGSKFHYVDSFEQDIEISIPRETKKNGTLYIHMFVSKGSSNWNSLIQDKDTVHVTVPLTRYAVPERLKFRLLDNSSVPEGSLKPVTHLKKSVSLLMLTDNITFARTEVPGEFYSLLKIRGNEYLPIITDNFLLDRASNLIELESGVDTTKIKFIYKAVGYGYFRFLLQFRVAMDSVKKLGFHDKDLDEMKTILTDTNLYLLLVTIAVSIIHMMFDFLAFKNDIMFWRSCKSWAGLSLRAVLWRAFSQIIICLYLYEENASLLILGPTVIGLFIEFWKVQKMIPVDWRRLKLKQIEQSAIELKTREFDAEIMRYLSYLLYPLCVAGAVYSLLYQPHRSWYSWLIQNSVYGVYCFDFLFMIPQLFVNYKLKSVAHLPWKTLMYKAFNTFIDDLFAFIITMPTASRIACFRDDIIFIIYIAQRWKYPVDKSRIDQDESEAAEQMISPEKKEQ